jgi:4-amino-4-deoxy-L-arabinose transferase-like glycosyltransferase
VAEVRFPFGMKLWPLLFLLVLCFMQFFWRLGEVPFYTRGESREGLVVWEMYKTGNWVLPIINGDYVPFKPPLFHWIGVLVAEITGRVDEFSIRFPSALFASLGVLVTYAAGARLWNEPTGRLAAFILVTNSQWWRAGTLAQVDMTLAFFITATLLLFSCLYQGENYSLIHSIGLAFLLACATLAKGPLGCLVPSLIVIIFLWFRGDFAFLRKLHLVAGATGFLLVAGSWYVLALWQGGPAFFMRQIVEESLGTAAGDYGRHQPYYYYVPVFFLNLAPWSFFFPPLLFFLYRRRRDLLKDHLLFPLVWLVSVFLFFSLALGKRGVYILPLYPAFALIFAAWWGNLDKENVIGGRWLTSAVAYLLAASSFAVVASIASFLLRSSHEQSQRLFPLVKNPKALGQILSFLTPPSVPTWICLALIAAAALLIFAILPRKKWGWVFVAITLMALATTVFLKTTYYPAIASTRTLKPFVVRLRQNIDPQAPLFFYRAFDYGTIFYSHRHIASYPQKANELQPVLLLMWEEDWQRLRGQNDLEMLDISEGRGPAGRHRLVLVKSPRLLPIPDTQQESEVIRRDRDDSAGD